MTEALSSWLNRYREDPARFARVLKEPVLWIEFRAEDQSDDERSLHTASGVSTHPLLGQPRLVAIKKQKDNAFRKRITLGRTPNNDVVIDDASVSRFHAWFEANDEGAWSLTDAGSKNGTWVSVKRLGPRKAHALQGGEKLRFGNVDGWFLTPEKLIERLKRRSA